MTPKDLSTAKNSNNKPSTDPKPVAAPAPVDPPLPEPPASQAAQDAGKSDGRTVISLSVPDKLARQIRLLAKLEGKTLSAIFLGAVEKDVPARLKIALAELKDEVE